MRPFLCLLALSVLVGASSCAAPTPRPVPTVEPGVFIIVLDDRLTWPYRLERLLVAMDGELLYQRVGGPFQRTIAALPTVARGVHTISVRADTALPTGTAGDECLVQLRSSKSFSSPSGDGAVQVSLLLREMRYDFVDRPTIDFSLRGLRLLDEVHAVPIRTTPRSCPPIAGSPDRLCLAEERVRQARADRDIIALNCYSEKLASMRSFAAIIEQRRAAIAQTDSADDGTHHRQVIAIAEQRMEQLGRELESCVCSHPVATGSEAFSVDSVDSVDSHDPVDRRPVGEGCRSRDPLDSFEPLDARNAL